MRFKQCFLVCYSFNNFLTTKICLVCQQVIQGSHLYIFIGICWLSKFERKARVVHITSWISRRHGLCCISSTIIPSTAISRCFIEAPPCAESARRTTKTLANRSEANGRVVGTRRAHAGRVGARWTVPAYEKNEVN